MAFFFYLSSLCNLDIVANKFYDRATVLPVKSDSDFTLGLQSYQRLIIDTLMY